MAGLIAAVSERPGDAEAVVARALPKMRYFPWLAGRMVAAAHFAAGLVLPRTVTPELWTGDPSDRFCAVFGEFFPNDSPVRDPGPVVDWISSSLAGPCPERLAEANGVYNLVTWSARTRELAIATDYTGALVLFETAIDRAHVWCSDPGVLLALQRSPGGLDRAGCRALLRLGYQLDERTAHVGVTAVGPGRVVRVRAGRPAVPSHVATAPLPRAEPGYEERFVSTLVDAVRLRVDPDATVHLPLTGGEDSRLILGALRRLGHMQLSTHTLDGCQTGDAFVAPRVAATVGVPHAGVALDAAAIVRYLDSLKAMLASTMDWHAAAYLPFLAGLGRGATLPLGFLGGTFGGRLQDVGPAPASGARLIANLHGRQRRYVSFLLRMSWSFARPTCPFADRRIAALALGTAHDECLNYVRTRAARRAFPALMRVPSGNDYGYGLPAGAIIRRRLRGQLETTRASRLLRRFVRQPWPFEYERLRPMTLAALDVLSEPERRLMARPAAEGPVMTALALLALTVCHGHNAAGTVLREIGADASLSSVTRSPEPA